jgi:site-specific DNA-methyltransferase (adenine-specific)
LEQENHRTIIQFAPDKEKIHPTQKPVALLEYLIKTYTNENDTVLDFTMGSGSTGVACKNLNRDFIGIELDQEYFKIAKERIESTNPLLI